MAHALLAGCSCSYVYQLQQISSKFQFHDKGVRWLPALDVSGDGAAQLHYVLCEGGVPHGQVKLQFVWSDAFNPKKKGIRTSGRATLATMLFT